MALVIYLIGCICAYLSLRRVFKDSEWTYEDIIYCSIMSLGTWGTTFLVLAIRFIRFVVIKTKDKTPPKWL